MLSLSEACACHCVIYVHFIASERTNFIGISGVLGMVVRAWDLAVSTMKTGEKSRFYCKDIYVYNDELAQSADSPQQNYIIYDIELICWQGSVYISIHFLVWFSLTWKVI